MPRILCVLHVAFSVLSGEIALKNRHFISVEIDVLCFLPLNMCIYKGMLLLVWYEFLNTLAANWYIIVFKKNIY